MTEPIDRLTRCRDSSGGRTKKNSMNWIKLLFETIFADYCSETEYVNILLGRTIHKLKVSRDIRLLYTVNHLFILLTVLLNSE